MFSGLRLRERPPLADGGRLAGQLIHLTIEFGHARLQVEPTQPWQAHIQHQAAGDIARR